MTNYRKELSLDLYELTMSQVFWRRGMDSNATFSLFFRGYPKDRAYYIASGIDDALDFLQDFRFSDDEIRAIRNVTPLADDFVDFLTDLRFTGTVRAVPEGSIIFADEPLLEVTGTVDRDPDRRDDAPKHRHHRIALGNQSRPYRPSR